MVENATVHIREVYSGSSLLADLIIQSVSGLYKNFTQMSPSAYVQGHRKSWTGFETAIT